MAYRQPRVIRPREHIQRFVISSCSDPLLFFAITLQGDTCGNSGYWPVRAAASSATLHVDLCRTCQYRLIYRDRVLRAKVEPGYLQYLDTRSNVWPQTFDTSQPRFAFEYRRHRRAVSADTFFHLPGLPDGDILRDDDMKFFFVIVDILDKRRDCRFRLRAGERKISAMRESYAGY